MTSAELKNIPGFYHIKLSMLSLRRERLYFLLERLFSFKAGDGFIYAPVLLAFGIGFYFSLKEEPSFFLSYISFLMSLGALILLQIKARESGSLKYYRIFFYALTLFLMGLMLAQYRTISVHEPILERKVGPVNIVGVIHAIDPLPAESGSRVWLKDLNIERIEIDKTPYMIRIKVREDEGVEPGQQIKVLAGLNPPSAPVMPGAFDFQRQSYFKKLGAVGFAYNTPEILEESFSSSIENILESLRLYIASEVSASVSSDLQGVMTTFMTGEKTAIEDDELEAMRASGLAHLLAISGLHVGLIAGVIFFFVRLTLAAFPSIALHYPIKKYAAFCALIAAFFYMLLVGATVPTQRAMIMTGIALFAIMIDRSPFSLRMVALAALLILIIMPESLVSVSFQMSFAAVTVLVWFYEQTRPIFQRLYQNAGIFRRIGLYIMGIAITTILAGSATAPLAFYHFQQWSVLGTLANVMAMPVMGLWVMPMAVLSYLGMILGISGIPLALMGYGVEWILDVAKYVAALEGAVLRISAISPVALISLAVASLCLMLGPVAIRIVGCFFIIISIMAFFASKPDIIVSGRGQQIGIYQEQGNMLHLSSLRSDRYSRENWQRRLNAPNVKKWPSGKGEILACDQSSCRAEIKGKKISFPKTVYAQKEECQWADIIIIPEPPSLGCRRAQVIDRRLTSREGAVAIYIQDNQKAIIETVNQIRGERPWSSNTF